MQGCDLVVIDPLPSGFDEFVDGIEVPELQLSM